MGTSRRVRLLAIGMAHLKAGRWPMAEAAAREAVDRAGPAEDAEALLLLGLAIAAGGDAARAAPVLHHLAQLRPDASHPCTDLPTLGAAVPARIIDRQFRACLRLAPADARLRMDYATWLMDHDLAAEAVQILRDGLYGPPARHLLGMALAECGEFAAAAEQFRIVTALAPEEPAGWANLAMMLKTETHFTEAIVAYDQALMRAPNDARIRVNRTVALLAAGRWSEAWQDYEWRLHLKEGKGLPRSALLPRLDQIGDLHGVRILATHEDGFGDTLHFMRYLPLLAARGAEVHALVPRPLARVVGTLPGVSLVAPQEGLPDYDFHCPMFSLPRAFDTTVETIPSAPYLRADPALSARWAQALPAEGFRVGIVWAGMARPWAEGFSALDRRRSAGLAVFAPLAGIEGVRLVSLQAGAPARQAKSPPVGMTLCDPMGAVTDFADTAAIVDNLDLVVSVDTSVVHLAGAMGKPLFLLDRYDNCWRWLAGRADSPWYPSLTIFRQARSFDWSTPMARVEAALRGLVAFRGVAETVHPFPAREFADAA